MGRCYSEETDYDLDALGDEAWLTGCPLCGDQCWLKGNKESRKATDDYLDQKNVMMTPKEGSQLCIKMAGYGIKESVVKAIQDDARAELLEENKQLREQLEIHNMLEKCIVCGQSYNPSLVESSHCIFCICDDYKNQLKQIKENSVYGLLNRLYAPTLKIVNDVESPMTIEERIEYVLKKDKALTQVKIKLNALAAEKMPCDDGNLTKLSFLDGKITLARELKSTLDS